ncbi:MAG: non-heme iron oxygenase ferredoxin subunit [candidate division Zixibacteria bacterium]|nr:non-heme iron oxygenase ferredoxin subunit [candidate division Zixibacteria bacterium]
MAGFVKVASVDEIPPGTIKAFEVDFTPILICNVEGHFYAVADECSHEEVSMANGRLMDNEIICQRHGARFSVIDGSVLGPPAVVPIETFKTKIEDNNVYIEVD